MVSIDDVARLAKVSPATVSRALRGIANVAPDKDRAVHEAAAQLGYVPSVTAHALATGQSLNIGVLSPNVNSWFYSQVLDGIQNVLAHAGYDLTLYCLGADEDERRRAFFEDLMPRRRLDGIITVAVNLEPENVANLTRIDCPFVCVGSRLEGVQTLCVDDYKVGQLAARHLIELGHTRFGHIGGSPRLETDSTDPNQRTKGFIAAIEDTGLHIDADWFRDGDFSITQGYDQAMSILNNPTHRPSAIFTSGDEMAFGVLKAARDLALRVPQDLSVIGVDNHSLSAFYGLTTIDQSVPQQGRQSAEALLRIIGDKKGKRALVIKDIELPIALIRRGSTGPAPESETLPASKRLSQSQI